MQHPTTVSSTVNAPRLGRSVSLDDASRMLQVSRRTLYTWIRNGRLRTIRTIGGSQRVLLESMREVLGGDLRADGGMA